MNCIELYQEYNKLIINLSNCFIKEVINHKKTDKIKLGIISNFIVMEHSVANDRLGIVKSLIEDERFDVKIITNNSPTKFYSIIMNYNINPVITHSGPISTLISKIIELDFDIILYPDIGMFTPYKFLAYNRLAPIQINTWGHSETSGMETIDYFISSTYYEPKDGQQNYTEKLIQLDSLCTYYYNRLKVFNLNVNINRKSLGFSEYTHLYCLLVTEYKFHPEFMDILLNILKSDSNALFLFISHKIHIEIFTTFLESFFKENMCHVRIYEAFDFPKYMEMVSCSDIVLDLYPFGGCNSTIDAFNVNKIVITLPSNKLSGRFTYGFYKKMKIDDAICNSKEEYVDKTLFYINHKEERSLLENKIKENKYLLFEETKSVDDWKNLLISLYQSNING